MAKLVWVTGRSGAGKSTLAESLKSTYNFLHFDVDVWSLGGDPITEAGELPTPERLAQNSRKHLWEPFVANYIKLFNGEETDMAVWEAFYEPLCKDILERWKAIPDCRMVIAQSVYLRRVRDYIRTQLPAVEFIILDTPAHLSSRRKVQQILESEHGVGKKEEDFLPIYDRNQIGFEGLQKGELNSWGIVVSEEVTGADVLVKVRALLKLQ
eukprot:TRINITY_DN4896_c0_g1_i1.p1 TRINITY_DN4896_c0_g1~~TRINITY_DN4896_c0_g1_i1.p1  ORF type:complete len:211 (+),score=17.34 TRINITY_DN4896_c0_g1_i1:42-674(+)